MCHSGVHFNPILYHDDDGGSGDNKGVEKV